MPLTNIDYNPGQDSMQDVFDKTNAAIDDINDNQIKWKVINIGDWNMDTTDIITIDLTTYGISDKNKVRSISVMIRSDPDASFNILAGSPYPLNQWAHVGSDFITQGSFGTIDFTGISNQLNLDRLPGGSSLFDNSDFDATSFNRGWVTIGYVE